MHGQSVVCLSVWTECVCVCLCVCVCVCVCSECLYVWCVNVGSVRIRSV